MRLPLQYIGKGYLGDTQLFLPAARGLMHLPFLFILWYKYIGVKRNMDGITSVDGVITWRILL
jgi:hypothetical protein